MTLDQIKQRLETLPAMDGDCGWRVAVTYQRANGVLPRSGDARPCNGEIVTDTGVVQIEEDILVSVREAPGGVEMILDPDCIVAIEPPADPV